jgi:hypothetical protein
MFKLLNNLVGSPVKELVKEITLHQGGQWIEKKELRIQEAKENSKLHFNPKAARTRSFQH